MSEQNEVQRQLAPPYLPFATVRTFLDRLKVGIPSRIDKSLMTSFSGAVQTNLLNALRYLGLVSSNGAPQDRLGALVNSEGAERQKLLTAVLRNAYPFLFSGFDLKATTAKHLAERFEEQGVSGGTVEKSVAFFLAAAKDADIPVSPHVKAVRGPRQPGRPRRQADPVGNGTGVPNAIEGDALSWAQMLLSKFPSFDPAWSDEVKSKWFDAFDKLMKRGEESE